MVLAWPVTPSLLNAREKPGPVEQAIGDISRQEIKKHIDYLASDELEGREACTEGGRKAGEYIAQIFQKYGLKPGGDDGSYYQQFPAQDLIGLQGMAILGENNSMTITQASNQALAYELYEDFVPMGFSGSNQVEAPLVFAGYGITAPEYNYDDYKDLDVKDKIVMLLRYEPQEKESQGAFAGPRYTKHAWLATKTKQAVTHGALGIIMVTGPRYHKEEIDMVEPFQPRRGVLNSAGKPITIPFVQITRKVANQLLKLAKRDLGKIQNQIDTQLRSQSFELPQVRMSLQTNIIYRQLSKKVKARNVIGYLEGSVPELRDRVIMIGAHYDHIGLGYWGATDNRRGEVHPGADDNASGTAAVIVLAKALGQLQTRPKRTVVFIAFDAEEMGCVGSAYYVDHPVFPLQDTALVINMDMIGRCRNNRFVIKASNNPAYRALLGGINKRNRDLRLKLKMSFGAGASDEINFSKKRVPYLGFYAGVHRDYHRVTDTSNKINTKAMEKLCRLLFRFVYDFSNL